MNVIMWILFSAAYLVFLGVLGSGVYFFITGAKANQAEAKLFEAEASLNRTRVESAKVANRVANEMGRKLASVDGLGEFALGFGSPADSTDTPCQCSKCKERRGEGNV